MEYLFFIIITLLILIPIISAKSDIKNNILEKNKAFTSASTKLMFAVLLSIILSVVIALNNNFSASSGHGGFINIIGPFFFGIIVLILYVASLGIKPELKFILGLISILINICIGFYYMSTEF